MLVYITTHIKTIGIPNHKSPVDRKKSFINDNE